MRSCSLTWRFRLCGKLSLARLESVGNFFLKSWVDIPCFSLYRCCNYLVSAPLRRWVWRAKKTVELFCPEVCPVRRQRVEGPCAMRGWKLECRCCPSVVLLQGWSRVQCTSPRDKPWWDLCFAFGPLFQRLLELLLPRLWMNGTLNVCLHLRLEPWNMAGLEGFGGCGGSASSESLLYLWCFWYEAKPGVKFTSGEAELACGLELILWWNRRTLLETTYHPTFYVLLAVLVTYKSVAVVSLIPGAETRMSHWGSGKCTNRPSSRGRGQGKEMFRRPGE